MARKSFVLSQFVEVLAPIATRFGDQAIALAPRLSSFDGRTIGLLWNAKPNGDIALKRVGELIQQQFPNVTVSFYSGSVPCETSLLRQAAQECDAVVACTAD